MTRSDLLEKLQTWGLVTVVTVLVWLYAEGEAVTQQQKRIHLEFVPPAGSEPMVIEPRTQTVRVLFRGSTGQLSRLDQNLEQKGPVRVEVTDQARGQAMEPPLVLREALRNSRLSRFGVNMTEVFPATRRLWVEPLVRKELPVRVAVGEAPLAQPPTVNPMRVAVQAPRSISRRFEHVQAIAPLTQRDLSEYTVGESHTIELPLILPGPLQDQRGVRMEKTSARVTFTLRRQTRKATLGRIPLELQLQPLLARHYEFDISDADLNLLDVELMGPASQIRKIQDGRVEVTAVIEPTSSRLEDLDFTGGAASMQMPIHLDLPPGVSATSQPAPVSVKVTRKSDSGG